MPGLVPDLAILPPLAAPPSRPCAGGPASAAAPRVLRRPRRCSSSFDRIQAGQPQRQPQLQLRRDRGDAGCALPAEEARAQPLLVWRCAGRGERRAEPPPPPPPAAPPLAHPGASPPASLGASPQLLPPPPAGVACVGAPAAAPQAPQRGLSPILRRRGAAVRCSQAQRLSCCRPVVGWLPRRHHPQSRPPPPPAPSFDASRPREARRAVPRRPVGVRAREPLRTTAADAVAGLGAVAPAAVQQGRERHRPPEGRRGPGLALCLDGKEREKKRARLFSPASAAEEGPASVPERRDLVRRCAENPATALAH